MPSLIGVATSSAGEAALAERECGPSRRLVTSIVNTPEQDVVGNEAIMQGTKCIGHVTSGGYAHHMGCSMAMGYVLHECSSADAALAVEINGNEYRARVVTEPVYDPSGSTMRS